MMFSVEMETPKLVITHFSARLGIVAAIVISYPKPMVLRLQYKIYLDPLTTTQQFLSPFPIGSVYLSTSQNLPPSQPPIPQTSIMKIIAWNVRGAANPNFRLNVQDLVNTHHPDIMVILEPKIGGSHAENVANQVGLSCNFWVDPQGFSGGI